MATIRIELTRRGGEYEACVWGKSSPILRPVPGNAYPAGAARWRSEADALAELPGLLGGDVEVVRCGAAVDTTALCYAAEIQRRDDTLTRQGSAAEVAAWLASWTGQAGRSVVVYRIAGGDWLPVDRRATRSQGTAPAGHQSGVTRDASWDAAVLAAKIDSAWSECT